MEDFMLPCLNKKFFGVECLGCGLQRSISLLVQGEFTAAFVMYPAVYPLLSLLIFVGVNFFYPVKFYGKIVAILGGLTALVMVISYLLKYL